MATAFGARMVTSANKAQITQLFLTIVATSFLRSLFLAWPLELNPSPY
jgi:hypothetical protein